MEYRIVKLTQLSGYKASIYTIFYENLQKSSLDIFINENKNVHLNEINDIISRLKVIGSKTGAREQYFRLHEGNPGDGVCALYDRPSSTLRLYCIRYAIFIVIAGGGGPKFVQKLQDDRKLKDENGFLRILSARISKRIRNGEIWFSDDNLELQGNLTFSDQEDE